MTSEYNHELTAPTESREIASVFTDSPSLLFGTPMDRTVALCVGIKLQDFWK